MDDSIPIDPDKGLDPHMMFCVRCGGESNSLTIGALRKAKLPTGQWVYSQADRRNETARDLIGRGMVKTRYDLDWVKLDEHERVPDPTPCDACAKELKQWAELVEQGGIYFRCKTCSATGVVKPGTDLAIAVRKQAEVDPPDAMGMEFQNCEQHANALEPEPQQQMGKIA